MSRSIGGPIRELGYQILLRAEEVLRMQKGTIGKTRALHVIAMIERTGASATDRNPGFFHKAVRDKLVLQLKESNATLQPEESRFVEIMTWYDPVQMRRELRSNLMRLVYVPQDPCIGLALDMHVMHDLIMRGRFGVRAGLNHIDDADFRGHEVLRMAFQRCIAHDLDVQALAKRYGFGHQLDTTACL